MGYWDNIKTSDNNKKTGNYWDNITLSKNQGRSDYIFDLQGEEISQQREADKLNTFESIAKETVKGAVGSIYDVAGGLLLPGATHEDLRNTTLLKDTLNPFSLKTGPLRAAYDISKEAITHPVQTTINAIGGAEKGFSKEVTNIITNLFVPDKDKAATAAKIKETLDYAFNFNNPDSNITQGFEIAGSAIPYILAGGAAGEVGGTIGSRLGGPTGARVGSAVGNVAGFTTVGQASIPTDSTLEARAERATQDLVALGLFELGSRGYQIAKNRIYQGMKAKVVAETPPPKETYFDKIKAPADLNRPLNEANTKTIKEDTLSGKREDLRLSNENVLQQSKDYGAIPKEATPDTLIEVQRATAEDGVIRPGDQITTSTANAEKYQSQREGSKIIKETVPVKDLVKSGGKGDEFIYAPKEARTSTFEEKQAIKDNISRTSQKVADEAIKRGLVEDFPELSEVDTMILKEQTELAREAIAKDKDAAIEAIKSTEIPELRKQSIFKELKSQAIREGDVNTIYELSKTNIGTETGQALKALDDSAEFGPADPVKAAKSIRESRIKEVETKEKIDVKKTIKEQKAKFKGPKNWVEFIDSITC